MMIHLEMNTEMQCGEEGVHVVCVSPDYRITSQQASPPQTLKRVLEQCWV